MNVGDVVFTDNPFLSKQLYGFVLEDSDGVYLLVQFKNYSQYVERSKTTLVREGSEFSSHNERKTFVKILNKLHG